MCTYLKTIFQLSFVEKCEPKKVMRFVFTIITEVLDTGTVNAT